MLMVLGFVLPIVLFLITLPIKALITTLKINLKLVEASGGKGVLGKLKNITNLDDSKSSQAKDSKAKRLVKKSLVLALKTTIALLQGLIRVIKGVIMAIETVVAFGTVGFIALMVVVISALSVVVIIASNSAITAVNLGGNTTQAQGSFTGYEYEKIDWSQDFSSKLDSIQSNYGKLDRDWVEWLIVVMNTSQQKADAQLPVWGFEGGFLINESGGGDFMSDPSGFPSKNISMKYVDISTINSNLGGTYDDGYAQITNSSWTVYNDLYPCLNSNVVISSSSSWEALRHYPPAVAYGVGVNIRGYLEKETDNDIITTAFNTMGVTVTPGKFNYLKTMCSGSLHYGTLPSSSVGGEDNAFKWGVIIALVNLAYCEDYLQYDSASDTYKYTEVSAKLSKSIVEKNGLCAGSSVALTNRIYSSLVGVSTLSHGSWFNAIMSIGDYGVIDKGGNATNMTLQGYLYSTMSDSAKQYITQNKDSSVEAACNSSHHQRILYDLTATIGTNYVLEKSVELLDLRSQLSPSYDNSSWLNACNSMAQWYVTDVKTYCQQDYTGGNPSTAGGRRWYGCPLIGNRTVANDCSGYVSACLAYAGYWDNYVSGGAFSSGGFVEGLGGGNILSSAGFVCYSTSDASYEVHAGDVMVNPGQHVEIVAKIENGIVYKYSWGDIYSSEPVSSNKSPDKYKAGYDIAWQLK